MPNAFNFLWNLPRSYLAEAARAKKPQAVTNRISKAILHPGSIASLLVVRLCSIADIFRTDVATIDSVIGKMAKLQPYIASLVCKTLANAWATTFRFRNCQSVLKCIFGCCDCPSDSFPCIDSLLHYLHCPILWKAIADGLNLSVPSGPIDRLCLGGVDNFLPLACAYYVYHVAKNSVHNTDSDRLVNHATTFKRRFGARAQGQLTELESR